MIFLHFISHSNVQMQNTDLVFVDSLLSAVNGYPESGVWGHLAERLMIPLRAAGKAEGQTGAHCIDI